MPETMPASFACPACRAPLRLRDRRFVGATFPCPECGVGLTLLALADGAATVSLASNLQEQTAKPIEPARKRAPSAARPQSPAAATQSPMTRGWWTSPVAVVSLLGLLGVAGLAILFGTLPQPSAESTDPSEPVISTSEPLSETPSATAPPSEPGWIARIDDSLVDRLSKLGRQLNEYEQRHAEFPPATLDQKRITPEQRWSWLALLELDRSMTTTVAGFDEARAWNDPASERFVRRQVPEFLNPQVREVVGENGYPTAHFVGSGGVGVDGPMLPSGHPRAGLFGHLAPRRRADVRDGLSQTIAVLGIETRSGSWAEGGPATVRPVTAEPYIRGPDGFGTGSANAMLVLMADGSVRTIHSETEPRLVRRMAAIADGLPLKADVPGEPGDRAAAPVPTSTSPQPSPVAQNPVDEPPVSALEASRGAGVAAVVRPDPQMVLAQRLIRFDQTKPVSRRELLSTIEDLFGRPIVWSEDELGPAALRLADLITLQLEDATVAELFDGILAETGIDFVIETERIRLHRSKSSSLTP